MAETEFFDLETPTEEASLFKAIDAYQRPSKADAFGAAVKSGFRTNISNQAYDLYRSHMGRRNPHMDEMLSAEEANAEFDTDIFTEGTRRVDAAIRTERNSLLMEQEGIMKEAQLGGLGRTFGTLGGGFADPLTAFLGGGLSGIASQVGKSLISTGRAVKFGQLLSASAQTGTPLSVITQEIVENAAAAAILEIPIAEALENVYAEEVSPQEHLFNIAVGTGAGFLLRRAGAALKKGVDAGLQSEIMQNALNRSVRNDRAPDFDKAIDDYKLELARHSANPNNVSIAYKAVDLPEESSTVAFSTHLDVVGEGQLVTSQITFGSHYGNSGLNLVFNPALAVGKAFDKPSGQVLKYDTANMKLLDLDESYDPNLPFMKRLKQFVEKNFPEDQAKDINEAETLKQALKLISDIAGENGDEAIQDNLNQVFAKQGWDGFLFDEDFFAGEKVGRAAFIFRDSDGVKKGFLGSKTLEADVKNAFEVSRHLETEAEFANVSPDEADNLSKERMDRGEYDNESPVYSSDEFAEDYKATFSKDSPKNEFNEAKLNEEITTVLDDAREIARQLDALAKDDPTSAVAAENAKIMNEAVERVQPLIEKYNQLTKAAIVCGKRNA